MNTSELRNDLQKALSCIDRNNYVLNSMIAHLEEQCQDEEVTLVEDKVFELDVKDYETREEFIKDYQPIFDLVDFPIVDCFRFLDKRTLNLEAF